MSNGTPSQTALRKMSAVSASDIDTWAVPCSALVVDDDSFVRTNLCRLLAYLGVERIESAADGAAARELLRTHGPFEIMTCDLQMPGADGVELLRGIAALQPNLKVVLISSMEPKILASIGELAIAQRVKLIGSLHKPVHLAALRQVLQKNGPALAKDRDRAGDAEIEAEELKQAIAAGEIDVYVQPQLDARTHELVGVEALARWISPRRGVVAPDRFIPLAESSGLIDELTTLICEQAMRACADWRQQGLYTHVAINFSMQSLVQLDLPDRIARMSSDFGLDPTQVVIEITESAAMVKVAGTLDVLSRLCLRKFKLSLDDFGTGFSSLSQLRRIPFGELKIDRSFVAGADEASSARAIIESSVQLAHSLDMKVVAEGIETQANWDTACALGCDVVQGYWIARPMPKSELVAWVARTLSA